LLRTTSDVGRRHRRQRLQLGYEPGDEAHDQDRPDGTTSEVEDGMSTRVTIDGDKFLINGRPTYPGRSFDGFSVEGQLFNTRMVQAIFDDANPATAARWAYPDTGVWDPERNVREFLQALPRYREHGITAVTVNLQGGMPVHGTEGDQPWENSAFGLDGALKPDYADRLRRVLDACDELGMVVIVGYFYGAQSRLLADEAAVLRATDEATEWLLGTGCENVLVEIANEIDIPVYHHDVLSAGRVAELVERAQRMSFGGRRLLVSASVTWLPFAAATTDLPFDLEAPGAEVLAAAAKASADDLFRVSDYLLLHTNMLDAENARAVIDAVERHPEVSARLRPLCINEDGTATANLDVAARSGVGWGYYDQGRNDYLDGFQSPPVNWGLSTDSKRAFFARVKEITGS
jgi:hypothetical protein